jgi:aryl-alcohol dehydrogenase-like predicted oxidoreductase
MEKRTLGKTGMDVTVLGFGGAEIGFQGVPLPTAGKLLNSALDAGLNVIDTAECYINSEELIGQTVAGRRNQFFCLPSAATIKTATTGIRRKWRRKLTVACNV